MPDIPSIFLSHGAPSIILEDNPVREFWRGLANDIEKPDAVLCISAHWETDAPMVSLAERPQTIHDFSGFPEALYDLSYPAPGAPELARKVVSLLSTNGLECQVDGERGLDHGAWIPMMEMFPQAQVPITQLSLPSKQDMSFQIALGRLLAPLRQEGVLILASGGATHNFRGFRPGSDVVPEWARQFDDELARIVEEGDEGALINYRNELGAMAHPRDEHLLPLGVAFGAGGDEVPGRILHRSFMDGAFSAAAYAFG